VRDVWRDLQHCAGFENAHLSIQIETELPLFEETDLLAEVTMLRHHGALE
jgi:hypothetical protein